tara:strand:+ start:998 stop:2302 length:1305 start_codon:yes stop_codon:yes gene_type:complete
MIAPQDRPKDLDAERGLLSSLVKGEVFAVALDEGVNDSTFTSSLHLELWKTIVALDKDKEPTDELSILQRLGKRVDDIGKENLWDVFKACDMSIHVERFAKAARESERLRRLQSLAYEVLDSVGERRKSIEVAEKADRELFGLNAQSSGLLDGKDVEDAAWRDFLEARAAGGRTGNPTGIKKLDAMLGGGLKRRTLTVLAARPSTGKTALALQASAFMMKDMGVYFQSLEMNAAALGKRLISHLSEVPIHSIDSGRLDNLQHQAVEEARQTLRNGKLSLDDKGGVSMSLCRAKARRVKDLGLVVVDYCGLVSPSDPRVPREQQIAGISKDCKLLAEELDCPVLLLSQLNRSAEQAQRAPKLSDLRESGALEQDADNVILLHQPDLGDKETIKLILAKNRSGETGIYDMKFERDIQTFKELGSALRKGYREPFMS